MVNTHFPGSILAPMEEKTGEEEEGGKKKKKKRSGSCLGGSNVKTGENNWGKRKAFPYIYLKVTYIYICINKYYRL